MPNEKDSTEKHLLNYADVFADVVNMLVFHGKRSHRPERPRFYRSPLCAYASR